MAVVFPLFATCLPGLYSTACWENMNSCTNLVFSPGCSGYPAGWSVAKSRSLPLPAGRLTSETREQILTLAPALRSYKQV